MIWYIPNLLILFFIGWWIQPKNETKRFYWAGLLLKMLAGITLGYIYFAGIGSGDTIGFHQQASRLYSLFTQSGSEYTNYLFTAHHPVYMSEFRNELFVKIISLFYIISGGDYWISSLYLSLIGFLGAWYFVKTIHLIYPKLFFVAAIAFLFLPSAVFWSSGVLKDPLVNAAVFFLAGISIRYHKNRTFQWWEVFFSVVALFLLYYLKYYLLAVILPILSCLIWNKILMIIPTKPSVKISLGILIVLAVIFLSSLLHWNLDFSHLPEVVHTNYEIIYDNSNKDNALSFTSLEPTWKSLLFNWPKGLFAGIFRPLPGEGSLTNFIHWLENTLLLFLALINGYFFLSIKIPMIFSRNISPNDKGFSLSLTGWLAIGYIIILASFLPLASPNFGSLMRYKAAYLPFLFFLLSIVPYQVFFCNKQKSEQIVH